MTVRNYEETRHDIGINKGQISGLAGKLYVIARGWIPDFQTRMIPPSR